MSTLEKLINECGNKITSIDSVAEYGVIKGWRAYSFDKCTDIFQTPKEAVENLLSCIQKGLA